MEFPTIKVQIDGVRHSITQALMVQARDVQEYADQQLKEAIASYDFAAAVREGIKDCIKSSIVRAVNNSFSHGEGARLIGEQVEQIIHGMKISQKDTSND